MNDESPRREDSPTAADRSDAINASQSEPPPVLPRYNFSEPRLLPDFIHPEGDTNRVRITPPDPRGYWWGGLAGYKGSAAVCALIVAIIGALSIVVECFTHILGEVFHDLMPNPGYLVAYILAPLTLLFNRALLHENGLKWLRARVSEEQLLSLAIGLTSLALLISGVTTIVIFPILLVAVIAILFFGLGILGYAPPLVFVVALHQLVHLCKRWREIGHKRVPISVVLTSGLGVVAAALYLFVYPFLVGYKVDYVLKVRLDGGDREVQFLRTINADSAILTLAYRARLPFWESNGRNLAAGKTATYWGFGGGSWTDEEEVKRARRLYFLMTGDSYATAPAPWTVRHQRPWNWIRGVAMEETGGTRVGRMVPNLSLASSKIEGTVISQAQVSEMDWTLVFHNADTENAEARADVILPPGAVVHKVSLWINGKERPAAFGPQATVRRAYQQVAVVQQRDPLLVTMPTPGKLLVQCFPVLPGKDMQIRLGITAPCASNGGLALPAFGQINFTQPGSLRHSYTILGDSRMMTTQGKLTPDQIFAPPTLVWDGGQPVPPAGKPDAIDLTVAIDTGEAVGKIFGKREWEALVETLGRELPRGSQVRFIDVRQGASARPGSFHDPVREKASLINWLNTRRWIGGADAVPALAALTKTNDSSRGRILYLHGPVPEAVSDPAPVSEAIKTRWKGMYDPAFVGLQMVTQAPDAIMDRLAMQGSVRAMTVASYSGKVDRAVADAVQQLSRMPMHEAEEKARAQSQESQDGKIWSATRTWSPGDDRKERLHAYQMALQIWYRFSNFGEEAYLGAKSAAKAHLVTPLSGAVVLETQAQYEQNNLEDPEKDTRREDDSKAKPTKDKSIAAPEPGTFVLAALGAGGFLIVLARRRKIQQVQQG